MSTSALSINTKRLHVGTENGKWRLPGTWIKRLLLSLSNEWARIVKGIVFAERLSHRFVQKWLEICRF